MSAFNRSWRHSTSSGARQKGGAAVIRITLSYVWQLAEQMDGLSRLDPNEKDFPKSDFLIACFEPMSALEALLQNSVFSPMLRSSRPLANALLDQLKSVTSGNWDGSAEALDIWRVKSAYSHFKVAFLAEFGVFPTFFVTPKGSHDTLMLLDWPKSLFADDLEKKVPEAMFDVAEAGKALCYEMSTACGYHLFRATEAVLRKYYSHVTGGKAHPKHRMLSVYIRAIRENNCGDEKILSVVEQMAKLHRNPIAHPEAVLTLDEALSIAGIARSAVTAMTAVLPEVQPTTNT